jgi:hypothetical protein
VDLDAEVGGGGTGVLGGAGIAEGAARGGEESRIGDEAKCIVGTAGIRLVYVLTFATSVSGDGRQESFE